MINYLKKGYSFNIEANDNSRFQDVNLHLTISYNKETVHTWGNLKNNQIIFNLGGVEINKINLAGLTIEDENILNEIKNEIELKKQEEDIIKKELELIIPKYIYWTITTSRISIIPLDENKEEIKTLNPEFIKLQKCIKYEHYEDINKFSENTSSDYDDYCVYHYGTCSYKDLQNFLEPIKKEKELKEQTQKEIEENFNNLTKDKIKVEVEKLQYGFLIKNKNIKKEDFHKINARYMKSIDLDDMDYFDHPSGWYISAKNIQILKNLNYVICNSNYKKIY